MTLGYLAAVKDGAPWSRVLFVGGAALQFWAHFLLVLPIVGLVVAHLALPGLHGRYSRRAFSLDCLFVFAVCLPAWPYFQASTARTQHITWLATPHHGDIMALLGPVVLPIAIDVMTPSRDARTLALMASVAGVILALESALLFHATVVSARYLEPQYLIALFDRHGVRAVAASFRGPYRHLFLSNDGALIGTEDGTVITRTGRTIDPPQGIPASRAIAFSPDDRWIVRVNGRSTFLVGAPDSTGPPRIIRLPIPARDLAWEPITSGTSVGPPIRR